MMNKTDAIKKASSMFGDVRKDDSGKLYVEKTIVSGFCEYACDPVDSFMEATKIKSDLIFTESLKNVGVSVKKAKEAVSKSREENVTGKVYQKIDWYFSQVV